MTGKVLDEVLKNRRMSTCLAAQNDLQLGFTEGLSPLMAALLLSEAMTHAAEQGETLYIASLDTKKAFNMVDHLTLFKQLDSESTDPVIWKTLKEWYDGLSSSVQSEIKNPEIAYCMPYVGPSFTALLLRGLQMTV